MKWLSRQFDERSIDYKIDGHKLFRFWEGTKHYHAWSVNGNEHYVWPMVKEAFQKDNGKRTDLILTTSNEYTFVEEEKFCYSGSLTKTVELYYNRNIIACFVLELLDEDFELSFVEFIKEGDWQKDVCDFSTWKEGNDELMRRNIDEMMERNRREKMNKTLDS